MVPTLQCMGIHTGRFMKNEKGSDYVEPGKPLLSKTTGEKAELYAHAD